MEQVCQIWGFGHAKIQMRYGSLIQETHAVLGYLTSVTSNALGRFMHVCCASFCNYCDHPNVVIWLQTPVNIVNEFMVPSCTPNADSWQKHTLNRSWKGWKNWIKSWKKCWTAQSDPFFIPSITSQSTVYWKVVLLNVIIGWSFHCFGDRISQQWAVGAESAECCEIRSLWLSCQTCGMQHLN